jgi:hypothetical protein
VKILQKHIVWINPLLSVLAHRASNHLIRRIMRKKFIGYLMLGMTLLLSIPACAVTFTGTVYEGSLGDTSVPSAGITMNLYGSNTYGVQGTWISLSVTNQSGFYSLEGPDTWEYNNIILEVPSGATAVGAQSISGTVLSPTWIVVPFSVVRGNLFIAGNDFWIERAVTCPDGCECLSVPAATEKYLTFERCSGDICGYDAPTVPRYCMRPVTTPVGPAEGTPCDDGNLCTIGDTYQNGVCVGGTPLVCDDQNPGTIDTCDPGQGCIFITQTPKEADCTCMLESEAKTRFISYVRCNDTPCGNVLVPQGDPCLYCNMFPQYCNCSEDPGHCVCDQYTQYYFRQVPLAIATPHLGETVPLVSMDSDRDGIPNGEDNCPSVANPDQADSEVTQVGCMPSPRGGCTPLLHEGDGVGDACDNCPAAYNPADENGIQTDGDSDGVGDACDNCPQVYNPRKASGQQEDADQDGVGDACDNCLFNSNSDQTDSNLDGEGDSCDCNDGIQGPLEEDWDCGGPCGPCSYCNVTTLPAAFDWRDFRGKNWISPINDQARCGSCWAQAAVGAMEARYALERDDPSMGQINLSAQYLVSAGIGGGDCYQGGTGIAAFAGIITKGVVDEACLPYTSGGCIPAVWNVNCFAPSATYPAASCTYDTKAKLNLTEYCDPSCWFGTGVKQGEGNCLKPNASLAGLCTDWRARRWSITSYARVTGSNGQAPSDDEIKRALVCYGPLEIGSDTWVHEIVLVGWNDTLTCKNWSTTGAWRHKNSYGTGYYENGFGCMPYDHPFTDFKNETYRIWGVKPFAG